MLSKQAVMEKIWPTVEALIRATLDEDNDAIASLLVPGSEAAVLHTLFGFPIFDLLLKTVLGREHVAVTRAVATEKGRTIHVEFVWPDTGAGDDGYTAADLVSVQCRRHKERWRVVAVNPAATDFPLTEPRAQGIMVTARRHDADDQALEPWLLPVALFAGNLQLPLRPEALADVVESLLLPGLQHRTYGVVALTGARRLWRDFKSRAAPELDNPAAWAAAAEFIMSEQTLRELTQAAVGKHYRVSLSALLPRIRQIKETVGIQGLDARYSSLGGTQIILRDGET